MGDKGGYCTDHSHSFGLWKAQTASFRRMSSPRGKWGAQGKRKISQRSQLIWKDSSDLAQTLHGVFRGFGDCLWFWSCISADIARLVQCIPCESCGLSWKHSWAQVRAMTQLNKGTFGCSLQGSVCEQPACSALTVKAVSGSCGQLYSS